MNTDTYSSAAVNERTLSGTVPLFTRFSQPTPPEQSAAALPLLSTVMVVGGVD